MSNTKQSSVVDWIFSQLPDEYTTTRSGFDVYQQAKAMHKEEIVKACNLQRNDYKGMPTFNKSGEEYYNETYGGNK